jgi:hypothetical protein
MNVVVKNWQKDLWAAVAGSGVKPGEIMVIGSGRQTGKSTYKMAVEQWMRMMQGTKVHHWKFHDGVTPINPGNQFGETVLPRGWTCWVYPDDDNEFVEWMNRMCPTADVTHRFNSGDPMYTVNISKDSEATAFQLRWM